MVNVLFFRIYVKLPEGISHQCSFNLYRRMLSAIGIQLSARREYEAERKRDAQTLQKIAYKNILSVVYTN